MLQTLDLVIAPDLALLVPSHEVLNFDQPLLNLVHDMALTMYDQGGIGLAAVQVGYNISAVVLHKEIEKFSGNLSIAKIIKDDLEYYALINPQILHYSERKVVLWTEGEGCLSLPGSKIQGLVKRSDKILLKFYNINKEELQAEYKNELATILQHEIDHINGILYTARMEDLKAEKLLARYCAMSLSNPNKIKFFQKQVKMNVETRPLERSYTREALDLYAKSIGMADQAIDRIWKNIISINHNIEEV